jgi:hypothetical protein
VFDRHQQQQSSSANSLRHQNQHRNAQQSSQQQQQQQQQYGGDRKRRRWDEGRGSPAEEDRMAGTIPPSSSGGGGGGVAMGPLARGGWPGRPASRDGRTGPMSSSPEVMERVRQALTVGFANKIARRMRLHNGYRTCNEKGSLAQVTAESAALLMTRLVSPGGSSCR